MKRLARDFTIVVIICVACTLFHLPACCRADEQPATQYLALARESMDKGLYGNALVNLVRASSLAPDDQEIASLSGEALKAIQKRITRYVVLSDFKNASGDEELHARFTQRLYSYLRAHTSSDVQVVDNQLLASLKKREATIPVLASITGSVYSLRVETMEDIGPNVQVATRRVPNPRRLEIAYRLNSVDANLPYWHHADETKEAQLVPLFVGAYRTLKPIGDLPRFEDKLLAGIETLGPIFQHLLQTKDVGEYYKETRNERDALMQQFYDEPAFVEEPVFSPTKSRAKVAQWPVYIRITDPEGIKTIVDREISEMEVALAGYGQAGQGAGSSQALPRLPADLEMREVLFNKVVEAVGGHILSSLKGFGLAYYQLAIESLGEGDSGQAVEQMTNYLVSSTSRLYPQNTERAVRCLEGATALRESQSGQWEEELCKLLGITTVATTLSRAYGHLMKGQYDRAITDYTTALEIEPHNADAYCNRGVAHSRKGEHDRAIADYTRAIEIDPSYAVAYNNRGSSYHDKGEYDRAITNYTKAIEIDPNHANAYFGRGSAYYQEDRYEAAIANCSRSIQIDPNSAGPYHVRGLAYIAKKCEYDRVIADQSKAIEIRPNWAPAYSARGLAYWFQRRWALAREDFEKALQLTQDGWAATTATKFLELDDLRKLGYY